MRWSNQPRDYRLPITPLTVPDLIAARPKAYVVPAQWHEVIARLRAHGIQLRELSRPETLDVTVYRLDDTSWAPRSSRIANPPTRFPATKAAC